MNEEQQIDADALAEEIARYLAAVDAFRMAGCEPTWRAELAASRAAPRSGLAVVRIETSAH